MTPDSARAADPTGTAAEEEWWGATVVLTGVGRPGQVGEVVADAFARRGANLVLVGRDKVRPERIAEQVRAVGADAHPFGCDLTDPDRVADLVQQVARIAPEGVKGLVHMAGGYAEGGAVADLDPITWHRLVSINLTTAFITSRAFLPLLRRARGSLVFFSSAAALPGAGVSGASAYAAAKGGVITLMRAIAAEERQAGVRANALAPKAIRTEANQVSMGGNHDYVDRATVAEWVCWLCSSVAGPVSGQVIGLG